MNYYIDTEFLEGKQKESFPISLFRKKTKPTIDLISIGIVSEDGREYYAVSKDFNLKEAWNRFDLKVNKLPRHNPGVKSDVLRARNEAGFSKVYWIRDNVLKPIFDELLKNHKYNWSFTYTNLKYLIDLHGKTNKQIAEEIKRFVYAPEQVRPMGTEEPINFYAYYAGYDWVAFCWLFGKMIDLPKGFPMYCIDLKQMMDNKALIYDDDKYSKLNLESKIKYLKTNSNYPKQANEHNALADARWNKELHKFLNKI